MKARYVYEIRYECRDIGYGVESGEVEAFWTGETDWAGKLTIQPVHGEPRLYLFPDEIISAA